jgi:uridine kinase
MVNHSEINRHILSHCIKGNAAGRIKRRKDYAQNIDFVFAVSGAAALGKTTFCKNLAGFLNDKGIKTEHIPLDGFMLDRPTRQKKELSGYNPQSTDIPLLINTMKELIYDGQEIKLPLYDHQNGNHAGFRPISPCRVIILDGIMSLHYEIREIFPNFNIFFYADDLVMRGLRLLVDLNERGYSVFEALAHSDEEFASYNKWIYHQISFADLHISVGRERELSISP